MNKVVGGLGSSFPRGDHEAATAMVFMLTIGPEVTIDKLLTVN